MTIEDRILAVQEEIAACARAAGRSPDDITLCAASKVQSDDTIRQAIGGGIRLCGENRVQELVAHLEGDAYRGAEVDFIGHLQTNKVRQVVGNVRLIHSVESLKLAQAIHNQAEKLGIVQDILLQVNIAGEGSKGGISPQETLPLCRQVADLPHLRLCGLMAIPPIATVAGENLKFFKEMHQLYVDIQREMVDNHSSINCLSMGMSGDFADAIACGATLVRVGTALFGSRPPKLTTEKRD